jgi:hypothetical protein
MRAALAKHGDGETLRQFDNELKDAGYQPPPDPNIAVDEKKSGLHSLPASSYHPDLKNSGLDEAAQSRVSSELNQMMSELKFQENLGASISERLAEVGPALQRMTEVERSAWINKQNSLVERLSGGKAAEVKALAVAALRRASGEFPKRLAASALMNEALVVISLANQEKYFGQFDQLRKRQR